MPIVWYIPPLSPVVEALTETGVDGGAAGNLFGAIDTLRIQAQCELNWAYALGHSTNYGNGSYQGLTVDGDFGSNTEAAIKNFQAHCMGAINPDGIIGPSTWSALSYLVSQPNYC